MQTAIGQGANPLAGVVPATTVVELDLGIGALRDKDLDFVVVGATVGIFGAFQALNPGMLNSETN